MLVKCDFEKPTKIYLVSYITLNLFIRKISTPGLCPTPFHAGSASADSFFTYVMKTQTDCL